MRMDFTAMNVKASEGFLHSGGGRERDFTEFWEVDGSGDAV